MLAALEALRGECAIGFTLQVLDVDADPVLEARYDELVPVLVAEEGETGGRELCHYFLDAPAVLAYLNYFRPAPDMCIQQG